MVTKYWTGSSGGDYASPGNWLTTIVPVAGEDVVIPADSPDITTGFAQGAVAIASFTVEEGAGSLIGTSDNSLQISCTGLIDFNGLGVTYLDVGTTMTSPTIRGTANAAFGKYGLYLSGTSIVTLNVLGGSVGVAITPNSSIASIGTMRVVGSASVRLGVRCTINNVYMTDGEVDVETSTTDIVMYGGNLATRGAVAITHKLITVHGGEAAIENEGTNPTVTLYGGETDFTGSGASRTVTAMNLNPGSAVRYDPAVVTVTNYNQSSGPLSISMERAD